MFVWYSSCSIRISPLRLWYLDSNRSLWLFLQPWFSKHRGDVFEAGGGCASREHGGSIGRVERNAFGQTVAASRSIDQSTARRTKQQQIHRDHPRFAWAWTFLHTPLYKNASWILSSSCGGSGNKVRCASLIIFRNW